jgi:hypothetical protein
MSAAGLQTSHVGYLFEAALSGGDDDEEIEARATPGRQGHSAWF